MQVDSDDNDGTDENGAARVDPCPDEPGPTPTTVAAIDAAVAGLDELDELPVADHVARFDAVHVALNVALSTIDRE